MEELVNLINNFWLLLEKYGEFAMGIPSDKKM